MEDYTDMLPILARGHTFTYEELILKPNFQNFPLYINYDTLIILETFHPKSQQATDFLIAIAEPITRPQNIHEFKLTAYSLYAACCVGLTNVEILESLNLFSKNVIPKSVVEFVNKCTVNCNKIKLVVTNNSYFVEGDDSLLVDKVLSKYLCNKKVLNLDKVKKRCVELDLPPIEEFDFRSNKRLNDSSVVDVDNMGELRISEWGEAIDEVETELEHKKEKTSENGLKDKNIDSLHLKSNPNPNIHNINNINTNSLLSNSSLLRFPYYGSFHIDLRPRVQIRPYQETCLNKMFSNGRARSGIIVLPCGAGKTLVGITALCTMKHPALILCTSSVSVEQWKQQLLSYTDISPENVCVFTADKKDFLAPITITTYTMLAYTGKRSKDALKILNKINKQVWGLLILDEVHVVPANMFRRVVSLRHYAKLGLTATLVREDSRIDDLHFLIGPKLFEADWQQLAINGHIAKVLCNEIWCKMTPDFYQAYLKTTIRKRKILAIMNPGKFATCASLIKHHENLGDKIIVFSDNVYALKAYALKLNRPFIYGPTGQIERMRILKQFQINNAVSTIFLSKVGDTSIDLPEATCLIQISSHFGSRRQEAQRLGRILRAKRRNDPGFKVFFYTLVSKDTDEMFYSTKRQQFLVDQGYSFNILQDYVTDSTVFGSKQEQKELLAAVLLSGNDSDENDDDDWKEGNIKDITGNENMAYLEKKRKKQ